MVDRISGEWARQLAFDAWSEEYPSVDFNKVGVIYCDPNLTEFRLPLPDETNPFSIEVVKLIVWEDYINNEATIMGFGVEANTLVIARTIDHVRVVQGLNRISRGEF